LTMRFASFSIASLTTSSVVSSVTKTFLISASASPTKSPTLSKSSAYASGESFSNSFVIWVNFIINKDINIGEFGICEFVKLLICWIGGLLVYEVVHSWLTSKFNHKNTGFENLTNIWFYQQITSKTSFPH